MLVRSIIVLLAASATVACADDPPRSAAVKAAMKEYESELNKLDEDYHKKSDKLREAYLKKLTGARADALAKKDLDEATRIATEEKDQADEGPGVGALHIITAKWGYHNSWTDVTPLARKAVKGGELRVKAAADLVAKVPDPANGHRKSLVIVYRYKGVSRVAIFGDDQSVVIPTPR